MLRYQVKQTECNFRKIKLFREKIHFSQLYCAAWAKLTLHKKQNLLEIVLTFTKEIFEEELHILCKVEFILVTHFARMTIFAGECFLFKLHLKRMKFGLNVKPPSSVYLKSLVTVMI